MAAEHVTSSAASHPHERVLNFSAGPAVLPVEVLEQAQADLLSWQGSGTHPPIGRPSSKCHVSFHCLFFAGMSVMEMSHRGKEFQSIIDAAEADLRALLSIPDNYHVLFMQACSGSAAVGSTTCPSCNSWLSALHAGRRIVSVLGHPSQPGRRGRHCGLHCHRQLVQEGRRRSVVSKLRSRFTHVIVPWSCLGACACRSQEVCQRECCGHG